MKAIYKALVDIFKSKEQKLLELKARRDALVSVYNNFDDIESRHVYELINLQTKINILEGKNK